VLSSLSLQVYFGCSTPSVYRRRAEDAIKP
jgi:hypothetical protein